ncbi:MAG: hypothetical protein ACXVCX_09345, partial [Ktedonobacterales bacterium]
MAALTAVISAIVECSIPLECATYRHGEQRDKLCSVALLACCVAWWGRLVSRVTTPYDPEGRAGLA